VPDPVTGDQVMAAVELRDGRTFDPARFDAFLGDQPDLGTKWAPRFVRVVVAIPVTTTEKIDKQPLRNAAWRTSDPVWWRRDRDSGYESLTPDNADALDRELDRNGRGALLRAVG
jgi:fatty-acyl-CoA synthase